MSLGSTRLSTSLAESSFAPSGAWGTSSGAAYTFWRAESHCCQILSMSSGWKAAISPVLTARHVKGSVGRRMNVGPATSSTAAGNIQPAVSNATRAPTRRVFRRERVELVDGPRVRALLLLGLVALELELFRHDLGHPVVGDADLTSTRRWVA